jgi:dihydrofolate reductase
MTNTPGPEPGAGRPFTGVVFIAGIDGVAMARKTYEQAPTLDPWPHEGRRVAVLSSRLASEIDQRISVHRTVAELVAALSTSGAARVYVDGGRVIQTSSPKA